MSDVRLYVDEDAGETVVVRGLLARGFDVVTTADAHRLGANDSEQLRFAAEQGRAIYTFNASDLPGSTASISATASTTRVSLWFPTNDTRSARRFGAWPDC